MHVVLVSRARALDGSEAHVSRPLEIPAIPTVGMNVRLDGRLYCVATVVYDFDYEAYVVGVHEEDLSGDAEPARLRSQLMRWCALHMPAWTVADGEEAAVRPGDVV